MIFRSIICHSRKFAIYEALCWLCINSRGSSSVPLCSRNPALYRIYFCLPPYLLCFLNYLSHDQFLSTCRCFIILKFAHLHKYELLPFLILNSCNHRVFLWLNVDLRLPPRGVCFAETVTLRIVHRFFIKLKKTTNI